MKFQNSDNVWTSLQYKCNSVAFFPSYDIKAIVYYKSNLYNMYNKECWAYKRLPSSEHWKFPKLRI